MFVHCKEHISLRNYSEVIKYNKCEKWTHKSCISRDLNELNFNDASNFSCIDCVNIRSPLESLNEIFEIIKTIYSKVALLESENKALKQQLKLHAGNKI